MAIDPSIIGNVMVPAAPQLPDVNAMMQTRTAGMENIYKIERQREADALAAQEREMDAVSKALAPAIASAFSDPTDEGLDAALNMVPPAYREAAQAQIEQLRAVPDLDRRKDLIRAGLAQDDYGRAILAQLEPTANMRLQAETAAQRAALDARRLQLEEQKLAAGEQMTPYQQAQIDLEKQKLARSGAQTGATTESERLAGYNAGRALDAAKRISSALEKDPNASAPGLVETAVGRVADPNVLRGEGRQRVAAAQRELIDALLTLATGAAYNREQLEGQMESYIPKWSDQPGTREDKRIALLGLIQNAKIKAGRAWTPEMDAAFQQLLTPPDAAAASPASESEDPELNDLLEKYLPK